MAHRSILKPKPKQFDTVKSKLKSFWEKHWALIVIFVAGFIIGIFALGFLL